MQAEAKEEVRSRLAIEDVIGEYVQLKRAGRNFKGLSPFGSEKTPSFFVSPEKQIWHDFSSNRGGDIFSFVMEVEGLDFRAALEQLARKAGVDLSVYEGAGSKEIAIRKKRLLELHDLAAKYYQISLVRNKSAVEYVFRDRKLSKQIVTDFRIGYAPDTGQALVNFLTKKGFTKKELADGGVVNRYGGDLFRGRMMVPLMSADGQVIGFTGRIIGEVENAPKYLNTPQTLLYDKSRHVFGLSQAKPAIRENSHAVIVEGNLDVVSSHQAGICQVVATAGTAMTEQQIRILKRLTDDIRLAYDGDPAGIAASERSIAVASAVDQELKIVSLPQDVKDPDELIQSDPKLWKKAIDETESAVDWIITQYAVREDLATASGKRAFTSAALALVANLQDTVVRDHYEEIIADKIGSSREAVHHKAEKLEVTVAQKPVKQIKNQIESSDVRFNYQDDLLAVVSIEPTTRELLSQFDHKLFAGAARQAYADYLEKLTGEVGNTTPQQLIEHDIYVKIVALRAETRYDTWSTDDKYFEVARLIRMLENENQLALKHQLIAELSQAELDNNDQKASELRAKLNILIKKLGRK